MRLIGLHCNTPCKLKTTRNFLTLHEVTGMIRHLKKRQCMIWHDTTWHDTTDMMGGETARYQTNHKNSMSLCADVYIEMIFIHAMKLLTMCRLNWSIPTKTKVQFAGLFLIERFNLPAWRRTILLAVQFPSHQLELYHF